MKKRGSGFGKDGIITIQKCIERIYEVFSPTRIEFHELDGIVYAGKPLRSRTSQAKESGLYVDFDLQAIDFRSSGQTVTSFEAMAKTSTLAYLAATADAVSRALVYSNFKFRLLAFGELACRVCSEEID